MTPAEITQAREIAAELASAGLILELGDDRHLASADLTRFLDLAARMCRVYRLDEPELLVELTSPMAAHLPGQHDQKTHGRGGVGPIAVTHEGGRRPKKGASELVGPPPGMEGTVSIARTKALDPGWEPRAVEAMRKVPGFESVNTAEEIRDRMVERMQENLDHPEFAARVADRDWYRDANGFNQRMAAEVGIHPDIATAVTARMSPQRDWNDNLALAQGTMRVWNENPEISRRDFDFLDREREKIWRGKHDEWERSKAKHDDWEARKARHDAGDGPDPGPRPRPALGDEPQLNRLSPADIDPHVGKRLQDLDPSVSGELIRPMMIQRGMTTAIELDGSPHLTKAGAPKQVMWQTNDVMASSVRILKNPGVDTVDVELGKQHKIRSFYNNMQDPNDTAGRADVTVDSHMLGVLVGNPYGSSKNTPVHSMFERPGSVAAGTKGVYPIAADAIRTHAAKLGVPASDIQAQSWMAQRDVWPPKSRTAASTATIEKIRQAQDKGQITDAEAASYVEAVRKQSPDVAPKGQGVNKASNYVGIPDEFKG